jgi:hypothetical protein
MKALELLHPAGHRSLEPGGKGHATGGDFERLLHRASSVVPEPIMAGGD